MTQGPDGASGLPPPDDVRGSRLVSRLAVDFLLRGVGDAAQLFEGDMVRAMIFMTLAQASVVGNRKASHEAAIYSDGVISDAQRRPVSTMAVANALSMPRETVRRHVNALVEMGYCVRLADRRLMVTEDVIRRPEVTASIHRTMQYFRRLLDLLKREQII
jgi:biotin operon repressor